MFIVQVDIHVGHALLWGMPYNFESYISASKSGYTLLTLSIHEAGWCISMLCMCVGL